MYSLKKNIWKKALITSESTIKDAIYSLEKSGTQIVIVIHKNNRLAGILTDGDIRRAILNEFTLNSHLNKIINDKPISVSPSTPRTDILHIMEENKIKHLPILDSNGVCVGLHTLNSIIETQKYENVIVIMAGGKGSRLKKITENCPKPMINVGGKPILEHIIIRAKKDGFNNFIISTHYLGHMIEEYFGDGKKNNVNIKYIRENTPLGTAGCLSLITKIPKKPIIVINGDVLTNISCSELLAYHNSRKASATMAVKQHEMQNQFGIVKTNGLDIVGFEEKPIYTSKINTGIYVINEAQLKFLEKNKHCDMPIFFEKIRENNGKTIIYPMYESWLDVGRPEELDQAKNMF